MTAIYFILKVRRDFAALYRANLGPKRVWALAQVDYFSFNKKTLWSCCCLG
jgi:hypothetical protein